MPVYEYCCDVCGSDAERTLPMARVNEDQFCEAIVAACTEHDSRASAPGCVPCQVSKVCHGRLSLVIPTRQSGRANLRFTPGFKTADGRKIATAKPKGLGNR